jgi:alkylation response protein AidB-like acyl-CoA dehydrogenase
MADLENFRRETRAWLEANCPPEMRRPMTSDEDTFWGGRNTKFSSEPQRIWFERMRDKGWTVPHWPKEYGGGGLDPEQAKIVRQEMAAISARQPLVSFGISMLGPALLKYGTDAQKKEHLPKISAGLIRWCQGYSEPNAGSDLASLQTRAESDGDDFVINGQKIWTSLAHLADWCFVLARTEAGSRRGGGLSYLLVPMDQPGITVRPIRQMTGTAEFNEVFFDDARTAAANVVGAPGDGWRIAKATLAIERGAAMLGQQVGFRRDFEDLAEAARRSGASRDPLIRDRLARAWIGLRLIREYALDTLGNHDPARASVLKVLWSRWHRDLGELAMDIVGPGSPDLVRWQRLFLFSRAETIYGGSDEIQHEIIATRALGLPRS